MRQSVNRAKQPEFLHSGVVFLLAITWLSLNLSVIALCLDNSKIVDLVYLLDSFCLIILLTRGI
jgi:hypothetical protein